MRGTGLSPDREHSPLSDESREFFAKFLSRNARAAQVSSSGGASRRMTQTPPDGSPASRTPSEDPLPFADTD
jgi:hypothetical protein